MGNLWTLRLSLPRHYFVCWEYGRLLCLCLTMLLFQAFINHCFICLLKHIAVVLRREKVYSLDFLTASVRSRLRISFWEGKDVMTLTIAHCGRDFPSVKSTVLLCSQVLSVVSLEANKNCCAVGSADFFETLDKARSQKAGMQYPFHLLPLQIKKLMHKPSFSVMGEIDMFLIVRTLLKRLYGFFGWEVNTVDFCRVR